VTIEIKCNHTLC